MEAYLDNSATTKPYPEVVEEMVSAMTKDYYNPSAAYRNGFVKGEKSKGRNKFLRKNKTQQFQSMPVAARGITEEVISSSHSSFWVFSTGLELRGVNLMQRPTFGTTRWLCP